MEFASKLNANRTVVNRTAARNPASGLNHGQARAEIHEIVHGEPRPQARLTVGAPDDVYEQEADRVADEVMRMPDAEVQRTEAGEEEPEEELQRTPLNAHAPPHIQRLCPACEEEMQRKAEPASVNATLSSPEGSMPQLQRETAEDEDARGSQETVSLKHADGNESRGEGGEVADLDTVVGNAFAGGGSPLPDTQRAFYESRFGADFSTVRVHTNAAAQSASQQINARAFTHGRDIAFASGAYQPGSTEGQRLLAHELTHTIQQGAAPQVDELQRKPASGITPAGGGTVWRYSARICERASTQFPDFPRTYISRVNVDLTSPDHPVTLTWAGPRAAEGETGPFRGSPGAGKCDKDCSNATTSRSDDSMCTPIGTHTVNGYSCRFTDSPEATNVTRFQRWSIGLHYYPSVPRYPASHGCVRLQSEHASRLIYDNSRRDVTQVVVGGTWTRGRRRGRPVCF